MRILIAHNRYRQAGGEDAVARAEADMLRSAGHDVYFYERSNSEIDGYSFLRKLRWLWALSWNPTSYAEISRIIREFKPDVVHCHNIFFVISPSIYSACRQAGVPVVQSLHNFRLMCSNALFLRDNRICEDCLRQRSRWPGVRYGCYKQSRVLTAFVVRMLDYHWRRETWQNMVDAYIMATAFGRHKYIQAGIPEEKIFIKPHVFDGNTDGYGGDEADYALFVGRLSHEKGVDFLVRAWERMPDIPLKIVGVGPLEAELKEFVRTKGLNNIEFTGFLDAADYDRMMRCARMLVVPSICYENYPRIIAEAYAYRLPVVTSRLGGMPDIIDDGRTGLLFAPEDQQDFCHKVRELHADTRWREYMRQQMKEKWRRELKQEHNLKQLERIYAQVIDARKYPQPVKEHHG